MGAGERSSAAAGLGYGSPFTGDLRWAGRSGCGPRPGDRVCSDHNPWVRQGTSAAPRLFAQERAGRALRIPATTADRPDTRERPATDQWSGRARRTAAAVGGLRAALGRRDPGRVSASAVGCCRSGVERLEVHLGTGRVGDLRVLDHEASALARAPRDDHLGPGRLDQLVGELVGGHAVLRAGRMMCPVELLLGDVSSFSSAIRSSRICALDRVAHALSGPLELVAGVLLVVDCSSHAGVASCCSMLLRAVSSSTRPSGSGKSTQVQRASRGARAGLDALLDALHPDQPGADVLGELVHRVELAGAVWAKSSSAAGSSRSLTAVTVTVTSTSSPSCSPATSREANVRARRRPQPGDGLVEARRAPPPPTW